MDFKSKLGYSRHSPFKHLPEIKINSGNITMRDTDIELIGIPVYENNRLGKPVIMKPKNDYVFEKAVAVIEKPYIKTKTFSFKNNCCK